MKNASKPNKHRMVRKPGNVSKLADSIFSSIRALKIKLDKRLANVLAEAAAAMLHCKSPNTIEIARIMPRQNRDPESNWRALSRFLCNLNVVVETVMAPMARAFILAQNAAKGHVVFMMDQSKIRDGRECLMISIRFGKRAIPFVWMVVDTKGSIGFKEQKKLLDICCRMLPAGIDVFFTADRFYGFKKLIRYCKRRNWQYRLRMRDNMHVYYRGKRLKTGDILKDYPDGLDSCRLGTPSGTATSIAAVWDRKQKEPWIIAMDGEPSKEKVREYGRRWGIESMFSDLKTRGFNITQTKLKTTVRIERLILIASVAMYYAVSIGMEPEHDPPKLSKKKRSDASSQFSQQD